MNFNPGDFVTTIHSCKPGLVIQKNNLNSLISINEYNGGL